MKRGKQIRQLLLQGCVKRSDNCSCGGVRGGEVRCEAGVKRSDSCCSVWGGSGVNRCEEVRQLVL